MKLSIWHQFSSNHSSRFTVIGIFKTPEDAAIAVETIEAMTKAAVDWMQKPENTALQERAADGRLIPATPPEREFAEQMGVEWKLSRYGDMFEAGWSRPMVIFDNLLFIDGTESNFGAYPYDDIVARLGGEVHVSGTLRTEIVEMQLSEDDKPEIYLDEGGSYSKLAITVSCQAPDESAASQIENEYLEFRMHVEQEKGSTRPEWTFRTPWSAYGRGRYSTVSGNLRRDGRLLTYDGLAFFHPADGFPAMISYLRAKGCTDIHYEFIEARDEDDD